ncbi:MAG: C-terminal binding protein [Desulfobacterales bacterium]|nr:C-terminal binding protein [Desulfobacterales bacterium]
MPFKVVNTIHIAGIDFGRKLLDPLDAQLVSAPSRTETELIKNTSDADAVICSGPVQPWTAKVIAAMQRCRIIASLGVGYDRIELETATRKGIVVTNVPDYCIDEVSTHTITLLLALGRKLFQADQAVRQQNVNFVPPSRSPLVEVMQPVFRLQYQTVGIVGFGKIGTATAVKSKALGMHVMAYDPYVYDAIMESLGVQPVNFNTLLKASDFICVNAALTEETQGMFGEDQFNKMKPSSFFINTARGEIHQEDALIKALQNGWIAGAGLDVTHEDPVGSTNPLLTVPNVILSGHSAWYSTTADSGPGFWHRAMSQVVQALQGAWPDYAVNTEVRPQWHTKWS